MVGYKLVRRRKNGTLGPLFINRSLVLRLRVRYTAENHPTKGFAVRPGFHICSKPTAPHLSKKGRVWIKVRFSDFASHKRPVCQGGLWYVANSMTVLKVLNSVKH